MDRAQRVLVEHVVPGRTADARMPNDEELKQTAIFAIDLDEASAKIRTGGPHDPEEDLALPIWAGVLPLRLVTGEPEPDEHVPSTIATPGLRDGLPAPRRRRVSVDRTRRRGPRCGRTSAGCRAPVWVLFAGAFVNRLGTFVLPFITLYLTEPGLLRAAGRSGSAAYGFGAIGAQGVGGLLADRIGRRNTIALSMFGGAALTLSLVWVDGLLADRRRGRAARLRRRALPAGVERADRRSDRAGGARGRVQRLPPGVEHRVRVSGSALGGLLAAHSYHLLFIGDAITSALFGVIALVALPHGTRTTKHEERHLAGAGPRWSADRVPAVPRGGVRDGRRLHAEREHVRAPRDRRSGYSTKVYGLLQA